MTTQTNTVLDSVKEAFAPVTEAFKNFQVLKGIPVDEFMGAMGLFSAATSMCCLECHAPDYAADTPRKVTTRKMIQMVNAINDDLLKGVGEPAPAGTQKVTCFTCHRGALKPLTAPPPGGGDRFTLDADDLVPCLA